MDEIGRPVAATAEGWIDKGLHQEWLDMIVLFPVGCQTGQSQRQNMGGQIGHSHSRQDQEAAIADHPVQIGSSGAFRPADIMVPAGQSEGGSWSYCCRNTCHNKLE